MKTKIILKNLHQAAVNCSANVNTEQSSRFNSSVIGTRAAVAFSAALLAACGGGNAADSTPDSTVSLASISTGYTTKLTTPTTLVPVTPSTTAPSTTAPVTAGTVITNAKIRNYGSAQTNVPFTFGQVFVAGQMAPTDGLAAKLADGTIVRLQMDVKATHPDGSVRHAIISGVLPALGNGETMQIDLAKSTVSEKSSVTPQGMLAAGLSSDVTVTIDGTKYTATLVDAIASGTPINWLSGSIANEWIFNAPLKDASGKVHPLLTARFDVRWYSGLTKQARVEVVVENDKTWVSGANLNYDVNVNVAGRSVYAKTGLSHYHHARWRKLAWWTAATEPSLDVQLNTAYLISTKAVPNYDQSVVMAESALADLGSQLTAPNTGPMSIGPVMAAMGTTGGRPDIGPLPHWSVMYLLSGDKRARDAMLAAADGSGSWSSHYRDEKTGYPVRTDNDTNKYISMHPNMANTGPLPVPRCAPSDTTQCQTPYAHDSAHQPSMVFLPYLLTGDYYYLEELQFWSAFNPLETAPGYSGNGQGLVRWQQVRGQAWSMRTLGHAAYITPDSHPLKNYFLTQLDNNLEFYNKTYVIGNPNKLGVYDGSGDGSFAINASAPWQDDFFTWSFGYLAELGFSKAQPMLQWKAKYVVGRMTAPDFCWIQAASYSLIFRDSPTSPAYDTFGQMYTTTINQTLASENGVRTSPQAVQDFLKLKCGSQEQANFLASINGGIWHLGRMTGYADSPLGYPANMQPALAVAASSGIANGQKAWSIYMGRADKPDFSKSPTWNIIPR
jgi:hypothetical protein